MFGYFVDVTAALSKSERRQPRDKNAYSSREQFYEDVLGEWYLEWTNLT